MLTFLRKISKYARSLLFDSQKITTVIILLGLVEICLNFVVIQYVKYTEIDWKTYMTHISLVKNGEYDYSKITGPTGPCVYPAGYLYVYFVLYSLSHHGKNVILAQYLFSIIYLINFLLVMNLYRISEKAPPYSLMLLTFTSYRIHSIYVLRLFNDPIAMLFLHLAINLLIYRKYFMATLVFSLALSVKMNILLYLPGFGIIMILAMGMGYAFFSGLIIVLMQIIIGLPFLMHDARAYLSRAFQFDRLFEYKWTVNWRFISQETFLDKRFHTFLLILHLSILTIFIFFKWIKNYGGISAFFKFTVNRNLDPNRILYIMFTSNFVGIVFARTLHYQFYVWYYYSLPFLLWAASGDPPMIKAQNIKNLFSKNIVFDMLRLLLWGLIEFAWNTFPSTTQSSLALNVCHWLILIGLLILPQNYENIEACVKIMEKEEKFSKINQSYPPLNAREKDDGQMITHKRKKFYIRS